MAMYSSIMTVRQQSYDGGGLRQINSR